MELKPLAFLATSAVNHALKQTSLVLSIYLGGLFKDFPYDMFVLEPKENETEVRLAGYNFKTQLLNEDSIIAKLPIKINRRLWFKVDDYGTKFVGTLLYPEEY